MKKVIKNPVLREKIQEAINLLCGTVKETLGPKGCNAIIDHSQFSPFITNDGVTIAQNIASDDEVINTILELAKEASIKTNENVGDGTTTTLVLLESIYNNGIKLIQEGYNGLILKEELERATAKVIEILKAKSRKPSLDNIQEIASIAANDKNIGQIFKEAYAKVGSKGIYLAESDDEVTSVTHTEGYILETILASPYYLNKGNEIKLDCPNVFITTCCLNYREEIGGLINFCLKNKESLIVVAKDYSSLFVNEMVSDYLNNNLDIVLLKSPGYGYTELDILDDLVAISGGVLVEDIAKVNIKVLGKVNQVRIDNENTIFNFTKNSEVSGLIEILKEKPSSFDRAKRVSMLDRGIVIIKVGAFTTTERREKKMRFEDALWAIKSAEDGILPGGGLVLYEISKTFDATTKGEEVLASSLASSMMQILINAALNYNKIMDYIVKNNYQIVYNVSSDKYEDTDKTKVVDATNIVIDTIKNAASIAALLLTTNSLIINEYKEIVKREDFNEM